jgi:LPXTG-motif cell wall-anchored protein
VRVRSLLAGGLLAAGISAVGVAVVAGPASAHDLTGGSADATCVGDTAQVTWTFVSGNAGDHVIQSVSFDRGVNSSSHTADTVTARTSESVGATVSLQATVVFEDDYQSSYTATTTIPGDICPPPTTTTVPPETTVPPTTTPVTTPPTTAAPQPTTAPTVRDTVAAPVIVPKQVTTTAAVRPATLPTTGTSSTMVIVAGIGALLIGGILLLAGRRGAAE